MAQIPLSSAAEAEHPERDAQRDDNVREIAADVGYKQLAIVNVVFVGPRDAGDGGWVLIDAGMFGSAAAIRAAAQARFGGKGRPSAIVMTHGHFDHVGSLETLARDWDVPVYAHSAERPFLNGSQSYPPADPSVGGGMMARLSPLFPTSPVNVGERLRALPDDGSVPPLPGWRFIHTPGHAPGHVSLWRERDRLLIAGDAIVTTQQESVYAAITQEPQMHGPPMYFTPDWPSAKRSVAELAALEPELVITGHGAAMQGAEMRAALHRLAENFDDIALPENRRTRSAD